MEIASMQSVPSMLYFNLHNVSMCCLVPISTHNVSASEFCQTLFSLSCSAARHMAVNWLVTLQHVMTPDKSQAPTCILYRKLLTVILCLNLELASPCNLKSGHATYCDCWFYWFKHFGAHVPDVLCLA